MQEYICGINQSKNIMKNAIIHFLPAKAGDCIVIEFFNKECIIMDCGFKSTYEEELRPLFF